MLNPHEYLNRSHSTGDWPDGGTGVGAVILRSQEQSHFATGAGLIGHTDFELGATHL